MAANLLERALASVAPQVALRRAVARQRFRRFTGSGGRGGYEGASHGRRTNKWLARLTDAGAADEPALVDLRNRSRDLVRNNAWAAAGVSAIESWTVGSGIVGQPVAGGPGAARAAQLWKEWAGSAFCDASHQHDLAGLQGLGMRATVESGGFLVRRRVRKPEDSKGMRVPLQLQVIEPDHLDMARRWAQGAGPGTGGNLVVQGVEINGIGRPVAFWLFPEHPGTAWPRKTMVSERIPAEQVLHVYRQNRIGQVQGVPWLAPALIRLRTLDEFEDGQLARMVSAGSFAAFITRAGEPYGDGNPNDAERLEELEPGIIEYLEPGESVTFPTMPNVSGLDSFTAQQLRAIASALGVPYEALTGDLSSVNFSSGRMGFNAFERLVQRWQRQILVRQFLEPVWRWFLEAAIAAGELPASAIDLEATWTPPARMILDPEKEGQAMYEAVRNGAMTVSEMLRAKGKDPISHLEELRDDFDLLEELDLPIDCNPRTSSAPGAGAAPGEEPGGEDEEEGDEEPSELSEPSEDDGDEPDSEAA